jgi:4-amino-4-deoxy-L-arabinose transferase-like glycosyltransferase
LRLIPKLLLAAAGLFLLYFYGLTHAGLLGPDEPRYAAIGREMALSGDWVTPRLWGAEWFEKPALLYWLVALGHVAKLGDDLAPRLPIAIFSVGFLLFYFARLRREFGQRAAWFSSAMLATSVGWLAYSRVAVTDLPLAAAYSASLLSAMPWIRSGGRRGLVLSGVFLGIAMLAKGLVPVILIAPLLWVGRKHWTDLFLLAGAALAIAAPWYIACYLRNGDVFIETFFWKHHFGRFTSPELQHVQPWWYYMPVLAGLLYPWTPGLAVLRRLDWGEPRRLMLALCVVFGFVFLSASTNKLPGYLLPLLPSVFALIGAQLAEVESRLVPVFAACLLTLFPVAAALLPEGVADGLSRASADAISWVAVIGFLAASLLIYLLARRSFILAMAATTFATTTAVVALLVHTFPELDRVASARPLWRKLSASGDLACIEETDRGLRYGLSYYARRELPSCSGERHRVNHGILDRDRGVSFESE